VLNADLHYVTLGGTYSYIRMCLSSVSQSWLKTKIIKLATIMTTIATLSLKLTEKELHQVALIRCQPNGYSAAKANAVFMCQWLYHFQRLIDCGSSYIKRSL